MSQGELAARYASHVWEKPAADFLRQRGLSHSIVARFGLGYVLDGPPRYRGRLSIPYQDGMYQIRGMRYRSLDRSMPKYLAPSGFSHLFAPRAADNPVVYLTEGEIDAMILWMLGYKAVGVPGAQAWQDEWRYIFRNCEEVVLVFDNDKPKEINGQMVNAGQIGAAKVWRSLNLITNVRAVLLPQGMDVNDVYLRQGEAALREMLES